MKSIYSILVMSLIVLFSTGCASVRGQVHLQVPATSQSVHANGRSVFINSVKDMRVFEVKPPEPNIPSLPDDNLNNQYEKAHIIARKRNGFGKAMGSISLKDGQTVDSVIKKSVEQAFMEKGYTVIEDRSNIKDNTTIVNVNIQKFWSWMNPGFWAITLSTEISTDLSMTNKEGSKKENVHVKESEHFQTGVGGNWIEVMQKALRQYIADVKTKI
jgi:hypothetical protein